MPTHRFVIIVLAAVLAVPIAAAPPAAPTAPEQPPAGPGGRSYPHGAVTWSTLGSGAAEVHTFEPADPTPLRAPVVVFGHGWGAMDPNYYGAWILHIVRRGHTVIVPRYQADLRTPVRDFTANALAATQRALDALRTPGHVAPDERGLVFAGHSMGGLVSANLAARAAKGELPPPLALMAVEPGKTWPEASPIAFELDDLSVLPNSLLLLAVVGDDDDFVREVDARKVYLGASAVPRANRDYVRLMSDDHGAPTLVADHRAPTAPGQVAGSEPLARPSFGPRLGARDDSSLGDRGPMVTDALDYYGTWKLLDGLLDAVFRGVNREYALGGTAEQRFMGRWSDGVPVRELSVREP
jgi:pimeloyl-ACP methyl ester carboxylesterase